MREVEMALLGSTDFGNLQAPIDLDRALAAYLQELPLTPFRTGQEQLLSAFLGSPDFAGLSGGGIAPTSFAKQNVLRGSSSAMGNAYLSDIATGGEQMNILGQLGSDIGYMSSIWPRLQAIRKQQQAALQSGGGGGLMSGLTGALIGGLVGGPIGAVGGGLLGGLG
jgi:hypothetical protein